MRVTKSYYECTVCHGHSEVDNLRFKAYSNDDETFMVSEVNVASYEDGMCSEDCVKAALDAWLQQRRRLREDAEAVELALAVGQEIKNVVLAGGQPS